MYAARGGRSTRRRNINDPFGRFTGRRIAGAVAVVPNQMVARTVARNMGLAVRNRAPRAAVKGAIASYGGRKELKYVDTANAVYACDTTGSVTCLNLIAVGDDNNTRDGRQVTIKSVQIHGYLSPFDTQTTPHKARVLLVWDNAANSGTIATIAMIMEAANGNSFPKVDNANRFTVLVDRVFTMGSVDSTATATWWAANATADLEIYKKINQITQYSGTTAAIGSIQNGSLLLVTLGTNASGGSSNLTAACRVRFTDM